ncbi:MAG: hypothetical protein Q7J27_03565, partial [Syntrophales bacterium]|nr:hypothetical protein [Syntrophales bacterium]
MKSNDAIVNLNYDCSLEGILDNYEVWSPNKGYARIENFFEDSLPENSKNIRIYKIHGSENFVQSTFLDNPNQTNIGFFVNEPIYPRSGKFKHLGGG